MILLSRLTKKAKAALRVPEIRTSLAYRHAEDMSKEHGLSNGLIVSFTSYPKRFGTLHYTVKSLRTQSVRPDKVILWLFKDDLAMLPASVSSLTDDVFEIRTVDRDIRSYKKLVPALREYPGANIVTADDDVWYKRDWLEQFVRACKSGCQGPLGRRGHEIRVDETGTPLHYKRWKHNVPPEGPSARLMLTGVGGILYPPNTFDERVLDEDTFMRICPTADDLWFYFMARQTGRSSERIGDEFEIFHWRGSQTSKLWAVNEQGENDLAFANLTDAFGPPF